MPGSWNRSPLLKKKPTTEVARKLTTTIPAYGQPFSRRATEFPETFIRFSAPSQMAKAAIMDTKSLSRFCRTENGQCGTKYWTM